MPDDHDERFERDDDAEYPRTYRKEGTVVLGTAQDERRKRTESGRYEHEAKRVRLKRHSPERIREQGAGKGRRERVRDHRQPERADEDERREDDVAATETREDVDCKSDERTRSK